MNEACMRWMLKVVVTGICGNWKKQAFMSKERWPGEKKEKELKSANERAFLKG